jgi:hypothetical protein
LLRLELTNDLGNHLTPSFSLLVLEPTSWEAARRRGGTALLAAWLQRVAVKAPGIRAQRWILACRWSAGKVRISPLLIDSVETRAFR